MQSIMQSGLVGAICRMGIFVICAQAIVNFRPKAAYEKYLKILVSSMILIQLFIAAGGIFGTERDEELEERVEWFAGSLEESMRQAAENAFFSEEALQFQVMGQDSEQLEGQAAEEVQGITVQIAPIDPIRVDAVRGVE